MAGNSGTGINRKFGGYPSPFFDIASTYVPPSIKELFKWTRYFYYSNSIISPIINKVAEYPITHLIYEDDKSTDKTRKVYKKILEQTMRINQSLIRIGLDYNTYGNAFITVLYPFKRYLSCKLCKKKHAISKVKYKIRSGFKIEGKCPTCEQDTSYSMHDVKVKNKSEINLIQWNPFDIDIMHNDITGQSIYFYKIPNKLKKGILNGKRALIETTPKIFIEAAIANKAVELDKNNFFHFKRPNISDSDLGWGMPLILPVIKDAFYSQVLKKGQEAIALDHLVPLRILFPSSNADSTPYHHINLGSWKNRLEGEIDKWRRDPNYITIMPQPVGIENFGGDMQALRITPELELSAQRIAGGMGVPLELLSGGMNWSGSSVSLRVLENSFLVYRSLITEFLECFLLPKLKAYFSLPECKVRLADFKMADDIQKKNLIHQLKQMGDISTTTLLKEMGGFEFSDEVKRMEDEQRMRHDLNKTMQTSAAEIQGDISIINARYQAEAQIEGDRAFQNYQDKANATDPNYDPNANAQPQMPGAQQPMLPSGEGAVPQDPTQQMAPPAAPQEQSKQQVEIAAEAYAKQLLSMPVEQRENYLKQIAVEMPNMYPLIVKKLKEVESSMQGGVDMRPLPEQKAPRRDNSPV